MIDPDEVLEAGRERRERRARLSAALGRLRYATERRVASGLTSLLLALLLAALLVYRFRSGEAASRSDVLLSILIAGLLAMTVKDTISALTVNPRDVALRELLEEWLERDNKREET